MSKFRKKPVVIEAIQYDGTNHEAIEAFLTDDFAGWVGRDLLIRTLENPDDPFTAPVGWWVIRGVQGEHYACKPDVFEATYEAVSA